MKSKVESVFWIPAGSSLSRSSKQHIKEKPSHLTAQTHIYMRVCIRIKHTHFTKKEILSGCMFASAIWLRFGVINYITAQENEKQNSEGRMNNNTTQIYHICKDLANRKATK